MEWTFSLHTIQQVARECWEATKGKQVLAIHGQMGAGKTTFIHALCDAKKVEDVVGSPTFSIINEYEYDCAGTKKMLFHLDLYRIKSEREAVEAGVEDVLHSGHICLVEWPEKIPLLFPEDTVHLYISLVDNETRALKIGNK